MMDAPFAAPPPSQFKPTGAFSQSPPRTHFVLERDASSRSLRDSRLTSVRGLPKRKSSIRIRNFRDSRRLSHDTKRYVATATANSTSQINAFIHRLTAYRTFEPLFSTNPLYAHGQHSLVEKEAAGTNPWETLDEVLDTSVAYLLRHNINDHFFATFNMVDELAPVRPKKKAAHEIGVVKADWYGEEGLAKDANNNNNNNVLMSAWSRDHPDASATDLDTQSIFWNSAERAKSSRQQYVQNLKREMQQLMGDELSKSREVSSYTTEEDFLTPPGGHRQTNEKEHQRRLWKNFQVGEQPGPHGLQLRRQILVVSDYQHSEEVHEWIQHSWPHRTHRHESAALRIQQAFRMYLARKTASRMRLARRLAFLECVAAEDEARMEWNTALKMNWEKNVNDDAAARTLKAMHFFVSKVNAIITKRRAARRAEEEAELEIRNYAATTIQRRFRGCLGRERAREVRFPELREAKERAHVFSLVARIQAAWRRFATLRLMQKWKEAACTMQRAFRCYTARRTLVRLRRARYLADKQERECFAIHSIERFFKKDLLCRKQYYLDHCESIHLIQRIGRAYRERKVLLNPPPKFSVQEAVNFISERRRKTLNIRGVKKFFQRVAARRQLSYTHLIQIDAALTIQAAWGAYHQKTKQRSFKNMLSIRDVLRTRIMREDAAFTVQNAWRSHALRSEESSTSESHDS